VKINANLGEKKRSGAPVAEVTESELLKTLISCPPLLFCKSINRWVPLVQGGHALQVQMSARGDEEQTGTLVSPDLEQ
jgi:hypothetical protein